MMVEKVANSTSTDCMVYMGPQPLLKVVPVLMNSTCLVDVMTNDVPQNNCITWDKVYPLAPESKNKPLFSS